MVIWLDSYLCVCVYTGFWKQGPDFNHLCIPIIYMFKKRGRECVSISYSLKGNKSHIQYFEEETGHFSILHLRRKQPKLEFTLVEIFQIAHLS